VDYLPSLLVFQRHNIARKHWSGHLQSDRRAVADAVSRLAPIRTEGINLRGIFRFPVDQAAGISGRYQRWWRHGAG